MPARLTAWLLATLLTLPVTGRAADFQISATTLAQGYELGAADGSVVARRRLAQFVRLNGYNLLRDNQLYFISSFRLDADFGLTETDLAIPGAQYLRQGIRELSRLNLSLMYGYLAGRNLGGWLDFDAGRQFVLDLVDFFHFDGVRLGFNTPWYFGVQVYGGYEVRAGAALGLSAFELGGVAEAADRAPTWGVGLYLRDTYWGPYAVTGKVTYRKTQTTRSLGSCADPVLAASRFECDRLEVSPDLADRREVETAFARDLVIEERLSANLQVRLEPVWLWGGFSYNLVNGWFDDLLFGAQGRLAGKRLLLRAEYLRSRPRFDADSIFNIFSTNALDDVRFRAGWTFPGGHELYGRGFVRFFHSQPAASFGVPPDDDLVTATGVVLGGRIRHGRRDYTTVDLMAQTGYGGDLGGADAWSHFFLLERKLALDGRLLVLWFDDDRQTNLHGINVTLQGGVRYRVHRLVTLHLILEESINRLKSAFRVYGLVDVSYWL